MDLVKTKKDRNRDGERGSALAISTVGMLVFILAAALAIDISHFYTVKTELQNAADAAALAGVPDLNGKDTGIGLAVDNALGILGYNKYEFNNRGIVMGDDPRQYVRFGVNLSDVSCDSDYADCGLTESEAAASPANIRFIRVRIPPQPVPVFFARVVMGDQGIGAKAVAGRSVPTNYYCNIAPLSAVQCDPPESPNYNPECKLLFSGTCPTPGIQPDGCDPAKQFCRGCNYTVRSAPSDGPSAGNYQILAFQQTGGAQVRLALAGSNNGCFTIGNCVQTEPGVSAGPIRQGINTRFDVYQGGNVNPLDHPPDPNIAEGSRSGSGNNQTAGGVTYTQYQEGNPFLAPRNTPRAYRRMMVVPIINHSEFSNGRTTVCISGFADFFLNTKVGGGNDGDIKFEYIGPAAPGAGYYNPDGGSGSNVIVPILYK